jgi:hypothetical protein
MRGVFPRIAPPESATAFAGDFAPTDLAIGAGATPNLQHRCRSLRRIRHFCLHGSLTNIVELIQRRFESDVCSVYLLEPESSRASSTTRSCGC